MEQPTPERPTPGPSAPERTPDVIPTPSPQTSLRQTPGRQTPLQTRDRRVQIRLQTLVGADDALVAWTRGWVSRELRLHRLLAARTFDFAVLTDRNLFLFSTGFFSRRPRRRVYSSRLDRINVSDHVLPRGRRLRITSRNAHPLWLELPVSHRTTAFADALVAHAHAD